MKSARFAFVVFTISAGLTLAGSHTEAITPDTRHSSPSSFLHEMEIWMGRQVQDRHATPAPGEVLRKANVRRNSCTCMSPSSSCMVDLHRDRPVSRFEIKSITPISAFHILT
jgi:hypothetical protein